MTGIDIKPQPHYVGEYFIQADALRPPVDLRRFDFIWASPPCQAYSVASHNQRAAGKEYPDLVADTRRLLQNSGAEWVIENVPGAPLRNDLVLDGTMFPGLRVIRERWFELSWAQLFAPMPKRERGLLQKGFVSVAGNGTQSWAYKKGLRWSIDNMRDAMGIHWMNRSELSQSIPPAYSRFIGLQAMRALGRAA